MRLVKVSAVVVAKTVVRWGLEWECCDHEFREDRLLLAMVISVACQWCAVLWLSEVKMNELRCR